MKNCIYYPIQQTKSQFSFICHAPMKKLPNQNSCPDFPYALENDAQVKMMTVQTKFQLPTTF